MSQQEPTIVERLRAAADAHQKERASRIDYAELERLMLAHAQQGGWRITLDAEDRTKLGFPDLKGSSVARKVVTEALEEHFQDLAVTFVSRGDLLHLDWSYKKKRQVSTNPF